MKNWLVSATPTGPLLEPSSYFWGLKEKKCPWARSLLVEHSNLRGPSNPPPTPQSKGSWSKPSNDSSFNSHALAKSRFLMDLPWLLRDPPSEPAVLHSPANLRHSPTGVDPAGAARALISSRAPPAESLDEPTALPMGADLARVAPQSLLVSMSMSIKKDLRALIWGLLLEQMRKIGPSKMRRSPKLKVGTLI